MKTADEVKKVADEFILKEKARIRRFYWDLIEIYVGDEAAHIQLINEGYIEIPEEECKEFLEGLKEEYAAKGLSEESAEKIIKKAMTSLEKELEGAGWQLIAAGVAPLGCNKQQKEEQIEIPRFNK